LNEPNTIVITEDLAMRMFGKTDVLNRNLQFDPRRWKFAQTTTLGSPFVESNEHLYMGDKISKRQSQLRVKKLNL
jgi:hypothetical protein